MKYPLVAILIMTACTLFAQGSNVNMMAVTNGIGIGAGIAVVASWSRNKSIKNSVTQCYRGSKQSERIDGAICYFAIGEELSVALTVRPSLTVSKRERSKS